MLKYLFRAAVAVALLVILLFGVAHFGGPRSVHRAYYPNGQLQLECPLDSSGRLHGDLHMYYPSGRLRSVTDYNHGQIGAGESYRDDRPDEAGDD